MQAFKKGLSDAVEVSGGLPVIRRTGGGQARFFGRLAPFHLIYPDFKSHAFPMSTPDLVCGDGGSAQVDCASGQDGFSAGGWD